MLKKKTTTRWRVLDQTFFAMLITFSMIELSNVGAGLIDGLIVSNFLGAEAMAAIGIAHPVFSFAGIFGGMFAAGMQTLCSRELSRGNVREFNRLFSAVMTLGTAFSLFLTAFLLLFAEPLAVVLGASGNGEALRTPAVAYLRGIGTGLPALVMTGVLAGAIQMDSGRKRVLAATFTGAVLNVLFDFVVVFLQMGMFGIGLATALGQYAQAVILFFHFTGKDRMLRFVSVRTSGKEMLELLYCGSEKALRRLGSLLRPVLVNHLVLLYGGGLAMTAMSVGNGIRDFGSMFSVGLADATALLTGILYGEMNDEGILQSRRVSLRYCAWFCGAVGVLLLVFARPLAGLYIAEEGEMFELTVFAIYMVALHVPLNGIVRPRISYLQATAHIRNTQVLSALSNPVYTVLSAFVLGSLFGTRGVLACIPAGDILCILTVWLYYVIKTKRRFPSLEDYMDLPEHFRRHPGDVIDLDIRSAEDVSLVSEQIGLFCKGHGIDAKTGNHAALCFEELADNIIRHGFPRCKKTPGIDLRVIHDEKGLVIRMRDNCPAFDVQRHIAMTLSEENADPEAHPGMKLIAAMAQDISYVHSLETNNVILRFPNPQGT